MSAAYPGFVPPSTPYHRAYVSLPKVPLTKRYRGLPNSPQLHRPTDDNSAYRRYVYKGATLSFFDIRGKTPFF